MAIALAVFCASQCPRIRGGMGNDIELGAHVFFLRACSFTCLLLPRAHPFVPLNHTLPFELCGSCVAESSFLMQVMMEIRVGAFLLHVIVVK